MSNKQRVLGNCSRGIVFILSAPAGCGKTTLIEMIKKEFSVVRQSVSCTTRPKRVGEVDGIHYHFLDTQTFERKILQGEFLEYVELFGNHYGTLLNDVTDITENGQHLFLVIDTKGAELVRKKIPTVSIFLAPPSVEQLKQRLYKRDTESPHDIALRLDEARRELEAAKEYDYIIVNDDKMVAYDILKSILIAEEHKAKNYEGIV